KIYIDDPNNPFQGCKPRKYPEEGFTAWLGDENYTPRALNVWSAPSDDSDNSDDSDKKPKVPTTGQIAYQGQVYVPEDKHVNATGTDNTHIKLRVKLDGQETIYDIPVPDTDNKLERGNFYDVIGKITNQGIEFNVRVKKWVKAPTSSVMPLAL
ncbi:MAG: hypothetical protein K2G69_01130, partial [Muribaculaceae bacterium]|nr:hypothetical protein [Muribaculaceae bacterium]